MMRTESILKAMLLLCALAAAAMGATQYTYVAIPATNNLQTGLINQIPNGIFTSNNLYSTPFSIPSAPGNCGPAQNSPCNFFDGFGFSGSGKSITIDVSIDSPTDVYALINAYTPAGGKQLATIQFIGSGGASLTFPLIGGQNIRDFYVGIFTNVLDNGVPGVSAVLAFTCNDPLNCLGSGATGNVATGKLGDYVLDEQDFALGTTFAGQRLTQIVYTDTYNGSNPLLIGLTVGKSQVACPAASAVPLACGVVNGANFQPAIAPGTYFTISGLDLSTTSPGRTWTGTDFTDGGIGLPLSLDNTSVMVNGKAASVEFVSPSQVNGIAPADASASGQPVPVVVTVNGAVSQSFAVPLNVIAPAFFTELPGTSDNGIYLIAQHASDYSRVGKPGLYPSDPGLTTPAVPGETVVFYGTGFGPTNPAAPDGQLVTQVSPLITVPTVTIGGVPAPVTFAGLVPPFAALYQFNVVIPSNLPSADAAVIATYPDGTTTKSELITVQ